ncbi:hypothetical protein [Methylotetracoccus oryzae]|uniref:hypothetical protein n=1 Tax=Methylotetracoccus oryzae TaxID=1919059 RepID=UPI00111AB05D|nr:hypothetical protein [Methylotetracoccus oryzae]
MVQRSEAGVIVPLRTLETKIMVFDEAGHEHARGDELTRYFIRRLDELDVRVEDDELSYDCNTPYDYMYFRLLSDAQVHWQKHFGFVPTPGELTKAFFGAEYERSKRDRLAKLSWVAKLSDYWHQRRRRRTLTA